MKQASQQDFLLSLDFMKIINIQHFKKKQSMNSDIYLFEDSPREILSLFYRLYSDVNEFSQSTGE